MDDVMQPNGQTIVFTPTRGDIIALQVRMLSRNRLYLVFMSGIFLFIVWADASHPNDPKLLFAVNLVIAILSALVIWMIVSVLMLVFLLVSVSGSRFKNILIEHTTFLTTEGIFVKSPAGEGILKWEGIHKVDSTSKLLIIYTNPSTARFLPKRSFPTPEAAAAFELAVRSHIHK